VSDRSAQELQALALGRLEQIKRELAAARKALAKDMTHEAADAIREIQQIVTDGLAELEELVNKEQQA
jgi:hypothetical protein